MSNSSVLLVPYLSKAAEKNLDGFTATKPSPPKKSLVENLQ